MRITGKILFLTLFLFLTINVYPLYLKICIYSSEQHNSVVVSPIVGKYQVIAGDKIIDSAGTEDSYIVDASGDLLILKKANVVIGQFSSILFRSAYTDNMLTIVPDNNGATHQYNHDIQINATGKGLQLLNIVDLEYYVAGVVECEAGYKKPDEFYRVQAIICRTYALSNIARHIADSYQLCDAVHCQVYRGAISKQNILEAVLTTKGIVITDTDNNLINAAFHTNCGGYTLNSEDAWSKNLPYLRSVKDTFCLHQPHAVWATSIPEKEWDDYLAMKEKDLKMDSIQNIHYKWVSTEKRIYLYDRGYIIPLKEIRNDNKLHSTYFTVNKDVDYYILKGHGSGHRVGLCQEGAINMARKGYKFPAILEFYYKKIKLINFNSLKNSGIN